MWIEWENGLINLKHVKRIYMEETHGNYFGSSGLTFSTTDGFLPVNHYSHYVKPKWTLKIKLMNEEGEYSETFDNKLAAYEKLDNIKFALGKSLKCI